LVISNLRRKERFDFGGSMAYCIGMNIDTWLLDPEAHDAHFALPTCPHCFEEILAEGECPDCDDEGEEDIHYEYEAPH